MSAQESKTPSIADIREKHLLANGLSVNKSDIGKRIQKAAYDAMTEYVSQCTASLEERLDAADSVIESRWEMILELEGKLKAEKECVNHMKEVCDETKAKADKLVIAAEKIHHLHMCEQEGISSGQPTPETWYKTVDELWEALADYKGGDK